MPSPRPALRIDARLLTWTVSTVLFAGTLLLFRRAIDCDFLDYDDPGYITLNGHVQAGLTWDSIRWAFTGRTDYWHPLTWLSHMIDWECFGGDAGAHHLTSVVWHAINAVLAFLVLRRLTGAFTASAFAAALFAWHPLRVESVAWVTERKDVMSGCFFLLTLLAYAAYAGRRAAGGRGRGAYVLTLLAFVAGLMSKPMVVSLPLVLLVLDFWPLRRATAAPGNLRALLIEKIPFAVLAAADAIVTILMQRGDGAFVLSLPLEARLGNAVVSLVRYIGKFLWPFDLAVCYPHPGHWPAWTVILATLALGALSTVAWTQRRARPWLLAGWLWFLIVLLPALGIVQVGFQAMADRYTYLATLGLELALVWTCRELRPRAMLAGLGVFVLAGSAARTHDQLSCWRDSETLFEHALAVSPRNSAAEGFLAYTYVAQRRLDAAERHARRALELDPASNPGRFALAQVDEARGRLLEAIAGYRQLLARNPRNDEAELSLALLLMVRQERDEAAAHFRAVAGRWPEVIEINRRLAAENLRARAYARAVVRYELAAAADPADAVAHYGLGLALDALGRPAAALDEFLRAAALSPSFAAAHALAGLRLLDGARQAEAETQFRAALAVQPRLGVASIGLGRVLVRQGRIGEATAILTQAVGLTPADAVAQRALAETLARAGRFAEAVEHYERAVQLRPQDAGAHTEFGYALYLAGRQREAAQQWREALRLDPTIPGLRARLDRLEASLAP